MKVIHKKLKFNGLPIVRIKKVGSAYYGLTADEVNGVKAIKAWHYLPETMYPLIKEAMKQCDSL